MKSKCPGCGEEFEIVSLTADERNLPEYSRQAYFAHLKHCAGTSRGMEDLPSTDPSPKRRTYPLYDNEGAQVQDDLWERMIRSTDPKLLRSNLPRGTYRTRGSVYAYLMDIEGFSAKNVSQAFQITEVAVRVDKFKALEAYLRDSGGQCKCKRRHWDPDAANCPHRVGRELVDEEVKRLFDRIEVQYWSQRKEERL